MKTRKFKTLNRWLDYIHKRHQRHDNEIYETVEDLFKEDWHFWYFTDYGTPKEKYNNDRVILDWQQKLPIAQKIVEFHWRRKPKYEQELIAEKLAKGEGNLSMLHYFSTSIKKKDGKWTFYYCSSSLIGPNHDYCLRQYLKSIK